MPRNSSGTMVPANGPYIVGQVADPTLVNARFADEEGELGDSLSRSGKGGMLAVLRGVDGTVAAPAYSYTGESGTGWYRAAAADLRAALAGIDALTITVAGLFHSAARYFLSSTATNSVVQVRGNRAATDTGADVETNGQVTRTAGLLLQVNNNGTPKLQVDYQGLVALVNQAAALQPAALWTAITTAGGWVAGNGLAYFKDCNGIVHVRGTATSPSSPALTPFTLPAGFRPATGTVRYFPLVNTTAGVINTMLAIDNTGAAGIGGTLANSAVYSFDSIHFIAEA